MLSGSTFRLGVGLWLEESEKEGTVSVVRDVGLIWLPCDESINVSSWKLKTGEY